MDPSRFCRCDARGHPREAWNAINPPTDGPGTAGAASPTPRGRRPIAVPIRVRARLADDREQLPEAHQPSLRGYRAQNQNTPAHAEARLRLQARKRRPRYARPAGIPRASEHPAHGALHRAGTDPVQGMVERLKPGLHPTFSAMRPRPDLETTVQRATTSRGRFGNPVRFDDLGRPTPACRNL